MAGLTLPGLAVALRPWLPGLITCLLFVSALRIGPRAAWGSLGDMRQTIGLALFNQLLTPLVVLGVLAALGWADTTPGLVLVLLLSAPSVTGAPNFTIMLGRDPAPPMRLLLIGTALFPLTVIPVLIAMPAFPTIGGVLEGALRLLFVITVAVGLAFAIRRNQPFGPDRLAALDGLASLLLGVVVVGLMSAVNPTLREAPQTLALWFVFAVTLNFGMQVLAYKFLPRTGEDRTGHAIIAGNRNIALFLVALPPEILAQILIFLGCYQVPMYLTPMVMARFYARPR